MRLAGHFYRAKDELASKIITWQPRRRRANVGRPRKNFYQQLIEDAGCRTLYKLEILKTDRNIMEGEDSIGPGNQPVRVSVCMD